MALVDKKITQQATWAEVSLAALVRNFGRMQAALRAAAPDADVLTVVKAAAYGHGASACAQALVQAGARWLGVTTVAEGQAIRTVLEKHQDSPRILLMRGLLPGEAGDALRAGLTPVVWTLAQMEALEAAAIGRGLAAGSVMVHVEVDTGMTRQGVSLELLPALLARFTAESPLRLEGVMTHFAAAEDVESPQNAAQMEAFEQALDMMRAAGLHPQLIHAGSTSTVDAGVALPALQLLAKRKHHGARLMCRTGIGLYGYALPLTGASSQVRDGLEPVLAWKTRILSISDVEAAARVGYNGTFTAERPMRLALLPVGYADGLRRELTSVGEVLIGGKRARIVGRVSMDVTSVDVTDIPGAMVGDEVVILGEQGGERVTADDHARIAGTIAYEILCGINARVPRLYLSDDEQ